MKYRKHAKYVPSTLRRDTSVQAPRGRAVARAMPDRRIVAAVSVMQRRLENLEGQLHTLHYQQARARFNAMQRRQHREVVDALDRDYVERERLIQIGEQAVQAAHAAVGDMNGPAAEEAAMDAMGVARSALAGVGSLDAAMSGRPRNPFATPCGPVRSVPKRPREPDEDGDHTRRRLYNALV